MDYDTPERPPMTPARRRQVFLAIGIMLFSLVGMVIWARLDTPNTLWQSRLTEDTLTIVYSAAGDLRDVQVELETKSGIIHSYHTPGAVSFEPITIPLRDFHTTRYLSTEADTPAHATRIYITATRATDGKVLRYTQKVWK